MKKQSIKEFKEKTLKELNDLLTTKAKELFNLKMDKETNKLKNTRMIFHKRKEIAVLKTLRRLKEKK